MEGTIFNIQRYSIDDGPGVRSTVFVKGCPLKCLWCSNPESQNPKPEVSYRYTSCKHCGTCVKTCPNGAITLDDDGVHIDREKCVVCGACVKACVPEALHISGERKSVEDVYKVVRRDIDYYKASNGGLTCSGGEILMQADFVSELFKRCHEDGILTNADTCGYGSAEAMDKLLANSDLVYFDLKQMDPEKHKEYTGVSNDIILENLKKVVDSGVDFVIRVPVIPGYNDSKENITKLAETVASLKPGAVVNLLPYHEYGANKYRMIDKTYTLTGIKPPSEEYMEELKAIVEAHGLVCKIS